jgi:hypothetical protein
MKELDNLFGNEPLNLKSLEKGIDEKMFSWMYVLLDYSYPNEIEDNVEEITRVLLDSYDSYKNKNPEISREFITQDIYFKKIEDYYNIALAVEENRKRVIN